MGLFAQCAPLLHVPLPALDGEHRDVCGTACRFQLAADQCHHLVPANAQVAALVARSDPQLDAAAIQSWAADEMAPYQAGLSSRARPWHRDSALVAAPSSFRESSSPWLPPRLRLVLEMHLCCRHMGTIGCSSANLLPNVTTHKAPGDRAA